MGLPPATLELPLLISSLPTATTSFAPRRQGAHRWRMADGLWRMVLGARRVSPDALPLPPPARLWRSALRPLPFLFPSSWKRVVDRNARGTLIISGSRVSVGSVVHAFWAGETPETICQAYPSLTLEQVYGAIAYYLAHRDQVDAELAAQETEVSRLRELSRMRNADLRSRLADARATRP